MRVTGTSPGPGASPSQCPASSSGPTAPQEAAEGQVSFHFIQLVEDETCLSVRVTATSLGRGASSSRGPAADQGHGGALFVAKFLPCTQYQDMCRTVTPQRKCIHFRCCLLGVAPDRGAAVCLHLFFACSFAFNVLTEELGRRNKELEQQLHDSRVDSAKLSFDFQSRLNKAEARHVYCA